MADAQLYREILSLLLALPSDQGCRHDVWDLFDFLHRRKCPFLGHRNAQRLKDDLQRCSLLFEVVPNGRKYFSVFPKTALNICPTHSNKGGSCPEGSCPELHLCTFFLLSGKCRYGKHCHFGHDLTTRHNQKLLHRHLLGGICLTDLRTLFCLPRVRQGATIPQVCRYYNMPRGCNKGSECHSLHLCQENVLESCRSADGCDKTHDTSHPQVIKVLTLYGVKVRGRRQGDILQEVKFYQENCQTGPGNAPGDRPGLEPGPAHGAGPRRSGSVPNLFGSHQMSLAPVANESAQRAPSVGRRQRNNSESSYASLANSRSTNAMGEEICLFHLKGECKFKENCKRLHSSDAFLWRLIPVEELTERDGASMSIGLPPDSSQALERAFCQPQENDCTVTNNQDDKIKVEFRDMEAENTRTKQRYRVRRLCIPSSGPSRYRDYATVWLWYWRDQSGDWLEFGWGEENAKLPVKSDIVEQNYETSARTPMRFGHFELNFARMRLKDANTNCKFKVRRRPMLLLDAESDTGDSDSDSDNTDERRRHGERYDHGDDYDNDHPDEDNDADEDDDDENDRDDEARARVVSAPCLDNILSPIYPRSKDYKTELQRFLSTLGVACNVLSIHKVLNPQLEGRYEMTRSSMNKQSGRRKQRVKQTRLYYGPLPNEDVTEIYSNGVDCDHPPVYVNGTDLGRGGYFYVNASQANKNVRSEKKRRMFLMKCLVDGATNGEWSNQGYDCRVDDSRNPKVYVLTNPSQTCPVYLITYSLR
ncbi:hypothetical protein ACOMHN_010532 [Nucella lapillus]